MLGIIEEHTQWCRLRALAPSTIASKRAVLGRLARHVDLETATTDELAAWWASRDLAVTTRSMEVAHVAVFYRWLVLTERRSDDPMVKIPRPRLPRPLPRPADEREVAAMIAAAPHPVADWLTLAAYAGLRAIEISRICGEDLVGDVLVVRAGKGGRGRLVPAHDRVLALAERWPAHGRVYWTLTGLPADAHAVSSLTSKWLRAQGARSTLHAYRHRMASQAYRACRDLRAVQELLGHASPGTTQRYVQVAEGVARAAVVALS